MTCGAPWDPPDAQASLFHIFNEVAGEELS
jgi:hypothetical protein